MDNSSFSLNPNELVRFLDKPASEFSRQDLIYFIKEHKIERINFRYVAEDGKLKTLSFIINSEAHLEEMLTYGERVDGSSLFSFISAGSSDLYVIPRYRTAFLNPFSEVPTLDILCSFYTSDGSPLASAPDTILRKAHQLFREKTGMNFLALGELEFYINAPRDRYFEVPDQKGYHASAPMSKFESLRNEALLLIARAGGRVKYSHNEVGTFTSTDEQFEQHEIEFLPSDVEEAADQLVIAKWILRMLAVKHGVELSWAPKITEGKAGSGLHIHMMATKDDRNMLTDDSGLSDLARRMIAGVLKAADALTAFGNTIPTSYLRLVPKQEAPTSICWGDRNRSVLVRVPLGWNGTNTMVNDANPAQKELPKESPGRQTFEFRAPDGSADIYLLLSGLVLASLDGLEDKDALDISRSLYVDEDIHKNREKYAHLKHLPSSCWESANALMEKRSLFEKYQVFPEGMLQSIADQLESYDDKDLSIRLEGDAEAIRELVIRYIHVM